ncbi:50S ribosomal protein L4 [Candidatus Nitronereus thalassa]|uniref:Large ribosomal subunit protein uL4 n=1 Tax=Candidatus Nitronereus thalassa TaxID=3020898 RepID=A0ABU3KBP3_9BACT|nr:50S ribosomal protein L4 [Candidatus Nitronereus thalassa]MDT7043856.1 50S ribosomal protein L4 [Candidatus Nitronereus thalassa]
MATIKVLDTGKKAAGSVELNDSVFGVPVKVPLVHSAVVMQRASLRQGTSSTKGRGEVSGTGKKPWKQKHTGRARAGSNRSPVWRHGGIVFGPRPRTYDYSIPKKMYRGAMQSALSSKQSAGELSIVSELSLSEAKTKQLSTMLSKLGLGRSALLVAGEENINLFRAARNLKDVRAVVPSEMTVYDVLRYESLVIVKDQLDKVQELWS